jgi:hypothetical protein
MCFMHETTLKQTHYVGYNINVFEDIKTQTSSPLRGARGSVVG